MTTLLLIEDDPQVRTVLRLALEDEDYRVVEAGDGTSGVKAFEAGEPDTVLLAARPSRRFGRPSPPACRPVPVGRSAATCAVAASCRSSPCPRRPTATTWWPG